VSYSSESLLPSQDGIFLEQGAVDILNGIGLGSVNDAGRRIGVVIRREVRLDRAFPSDYGGTHAPLLAAISFPSGTVAKKPEAQMRSY